MKDLSTIERRELGSLLRSVVKVLTISDAPDYEQPWQTTGPTSSSGSGTVVETSRGLRVLTNAHCVENQVFIEVRRYGKARRFVAEVEAIGHECDLALLRVEDDSFFGGVDPIPIGDLPELGDRVQVCGYPIGGERISITQGIVSRIELVQYAQSQRRLLAVQIDAAINAGNSGGPVVKDSALVGVAFQALEGAERIGHMIASPVVQHFLKDIEDGVYDGFPSLGVKVQALDARSHRAFLGLPTESDTGVLVTHVVYGSSAWEILRPGDVLLELDGVPIASDGTVPIRNGELLELDYVVSNRQVGETMLVRIWRDQAEMDCVVLLREPRYLVAEDRYDVPATYYLYGGLLLVPLTRDYLKTWGDSWWMTAPRHLMAIYEGGIQTPELQEPVVLQKVLADRVNQGYHELESLLIDSVQGVKVRCLKHLIDVVEESSEEFVRFGTSDGQSIVLDRALCEVRRDAVMKRFGVPHDRSPDLRRVLSQRPGPASCPPEDSVQPPAHEPAIAE